MISARPFLFLSGEFRITMPAVFLRDSWQHTMSSDKLILLDNKKIRRSKFVNEEIDGVIFYADLQDKELEISNLKLLLENNIPCWPSPDILLKMTDRHRVMELCVKNGFVDHEVVQTSGAVDYDVIKATQICSSLEYPFVIKTGFEHRGLGKYLIKNEDDLKEFKYDGEITYEPFFKGSSVRILIIDQFNFGIKIDNKDSWIANSPGAETSIFDVDPKSDIAIHARNVANYFGLEFAGVDYIVGDDGKHHFLEINQFPGLDIDDSITPIVKNALSNKMDYVEALRWIV